MVDPIADMLTRIRNALMVNKDTTSLPYSKTKEAIAKVLKKHGFITGVKVTTDKFKVLELTLFDESNNRITTIERISKPGRRVYTASNLIPRVLNGRGIVVVSTPNGIMSGDEAKKQGLGGELMCRVW